MRKGDNRTLVLYFETVTHAPTVKFIPDEKRTLCTYARDYIGKGENL